MLIRRCKFSDPQERDSVSHYQKKRKEHVFFRSLENTYYFVDGGCENVQRRNTNQSNEGVNVEVLVLVNIRFADEERPVEGRLERQKPRALHVATHTIVVHPSAIIFYFFLEIWSSETIYKRKYSMTLP